jgi:hypothetical protein
MSAHRCCEIAPGRSSSRLARRGFNVGGGVASGAALVLLPKCPMCLAAYIALETGVGISMTGAAYLWVSLLVLCVGSLFYFAVLIFRRGQKRPGHFLAP